MFSEFVNDNAWNIVLFLLFFCDEKTYWDVQNSYLYSLTVIIETDLTNLNKVFQKTI